MKKTLRKILLLAMGALMTLALITACTGKEELEESMLDIQEMSSTFETFSEEEKELRDLYHTFYVEKSQSESFISDAEIALYEDKGFYIRNDGEGWISSYDERYHETNDYYYPILIADAIPPEEQDFSSDRLGESTVVEDRQILYTDKYGNLCLYDIASGKDKTIGYNVHLREKMKYIDSNERYSVAIEDDKIQLWEFGVKKAGAKLPENAHYVGYGYWEGYLFRSGNEVYSVQLKEKEKESEDSGSIPEIVVERIAQGVEYVIAADYKLNSDAWEQPLFYMNDGTVKAYCDWAGEENSPRDDKSHLISIQYEGGYQ